MKTCRNCIYYNIKYENCKNQPINAKLDLRTAVKCQLYTKIPNNLKISRKIKKLKRGEREELIGLQKLRESWQTKSECMRNINKLNFSYRARADLKKDIAEINAIEKWEFIGGYYEIEDKIIEKLDNEKCIENGKS